MLKFLNVTKIYYNKSNNSEEPVVALHNVTFEVHKGEFVCVVGKSGAGKSTMVRLLIREEKPTKGGIFFDNQNICFLKGRKLQEVRRKIGVVYQDYKLLSNKTVEENLGYIMEVMGVSDETVQRDVKKVLEIVGIEKRCLHFPCELSSGEKQRLAIARALIHRPEMIVADEPTGNLDLYNTYEVINLFKQINEMGTTVLLLTHNKDVVEFLKKRVITLEQGRVISDDPKGKFIL